MPLAIFTTFGRRGPRHYVVVWLFRNRYRQFEFISPTKIKGFSAYNTRLKPLSNRPQVKESTSGKTNKSSLNRAFCLLVDGQGLEYVFLPDGFYVA
jgi:hypothetical protein